MKSNIYVQYGCGNSAPLGWQNFDNSLTLLFERIPIIGSLYTKNATRFPKEVKYGDIIKGLPVAEESCMGVYCSHLLEHLSLYDFRIALQNTFKILQSGGIFRLVVPDLDYSAKSYLNDTSYDASYKFMRNTFLGLEKRNRSLMGFLSSWFGNSNHLWMWDNKSLQFELKEVGFIGIRRAYFGDSKDAEFYKVEDQSRWENCLGIECQKP